MWHEPNGMLRITKFKSWLNYYYYYSHVRFFRLVFLDLVGDSTSDM